MMEPAVCQDIEATEEAQLERELKESSLVELSRAAQPTSARVPVERARALAESILALCDPWRTRFLELIARYLGADVELDSLEVEQLAGWLVDEVLHERIGVMLRAWMGPKQVGSTPVDRLG